MILGHKGRPTFPKRMNFRKSSEGGGGSFSIHKFILQIFAIIDDTPVMNFGEKKLQYDFPKMRGGQRPFGTFPKIHPFWSCQASLRIGFVFFNHI